MPYNHNASSPASPASWNDYWDKAGLGPPRPTLLAALAALRAERREPGRAVDLGCGIGRDALPLLAAGWQVTVVDCAATALQRLAEAA
jgi:2-polyprenyl-3-methyl-5-hydroxy-6-metoxy-1,4-benzoquinol methylase